MRRYFGGAGVGSNTASGCFQGMWGWVSASGFGSGKLGALMDSAGSFELSAQAPPAESSRKDISIMPSKEPS